ncbi:hypothetical protein M758_12G183700 [Ceratodon purpureus]|nr:hypothetical protein M758_12G183700 [Ceratodon purpureus]
MGRESPRSMDALDSGAMADFWWVARVSLDSAAPSSCGIEKQKNVVPVFLLINFCLSGHVIPFRERPWLL